MSRRGGGRAPRWYFLIVEQYVLFSNPRSIVASYQNDILLLNDLYFVFNKNFNLLVSGEFKAPGGEAEHDPRGVQQAERRV